MPAKLYGADQTLRLPNVEVVGLPLTAMPDLPSGAKVAASATRIFTYQVEDLGAGVDIADRAIFKVPAGHKVTVLSAEIVALAEPAGIDDANTCVIVLKNGTDTMVSKTFNTATAFPANGTAGASLGTVGNAICAANGRWFFSITNGATANPPMFLLEVVYTLETV